MKKKFPLISAVTFLLITVILTETVISYAWLSLGKITPGGFFSLNADKLSLPEFTMWIYDRENSTSESHAYKTINNKDNQEYCITPVEVAEQNVNGFTKFEIRLDDLHFGNVDNLLLLHESNYVYMCFRFHVPEHGNNKLRMNFSFSDGNDFVTLYGKNVSGGDSLDGSVYSSITEDGVLSEIHSLNETFPLLGFSYCLTLDEADFTSLDYSGFHSFGTPVELNSDELAVFGSSDYYCLYIRLSPDLNALSQMATTINQYMPCILIFKTILEVEVR